MPALRCGADRLGEYKHLFKDARVGLVTTPTGRTSDGRSTIAALQQAADLRVLLGPEHGVRGDGAAGAFIPQYTDAATGLPVFSLYGKDSKRLTPAMLETFDVLVYDIQDVGSRYYTSPRWPTSSRIAPGRASGWWCWTAPTHWAERSSRVQLCAPVWRALWAAIRSPLATP